jgi:hypothetical protein
MQGNVAPLSALLPAFSALAPQGAAAGLIDEKAIADHLAVQAIIRSYQVNISIIYVNTLELTNLWLECRCVSTSSDYINIRSSFGYGRVIINLGRGREVILNF